MNKALAVLAVLGLFVLTIIYSFGFFDGTGLAIDIKNNSAQINNSYNVTIFNNSESNNSTTLNQSANFSAGFANSTYGLDHERKIRADQLISLFENGAIDIPYGYAEDLWDGRGITCGRAGFTTSDGEVYEVVKRYSDRKLGNILSKYLPELKRLKTAGSGDTSGLEGFIEDWQTATNDPIFREVQDELSDELYYKPAMDYAQVLGLKTSLAKAFIYDTMIQHGNGDDPDSLPSLMKKTEKLAGGTPKIGISEKVWLREFIAVRRADLANAYDEETREVWADSVSRCDVFLEILESGNIDLKGPIEIGNEDYRGEILP